MSKDHPWPIFMHFADVTTRSSIRRAKPALKGTSISVREFLTKARQAIFCKVRQHFGMKAVWTQSGNIVVKTPEGHRRKVLYMEHLFLLLERHPRAVVTLPLQPRIVATLLP